MKMKDNQNLLIQGVANLLLTIPVWLVTAVWSWFIFFGICLGMLKLEPSQLPNIIYFVAFCPLLIMPISCIYGMIRGFVHRKDKYGIGCGILSGIGLLIFVLSVWGIVYIGSRY